MKRHGMEVIEDVDSAVFRKKLEPVYKQYSSRFGSMMQRIAAEQ